MKKVLLLIALIAVVVLAGCGSPSSIISRPILITSGLGILGGEIGYVNETPNEITHPGYIGNTYFTVLNGRDGARLIKVSLRSPDSTECKLGFEPFPEEYFSWITISPTVFTLSKNSNQKVDISITMPSETDYIDKKAEVRILVEDISQTGFAQIAVEARWYIVTAK